jgi:hypothetical protein
MSTAVGHLGARPGRRRAKNDADMTFLATKRRCSRGAERAAAIAAQYGRSRWLAPLAVGMIGAAVIILSWSLLGPFGTTYLDWDRAHYMAATSRWLDMGTPYLAQDVAASFDYQPDTFLHPPIALVLFLPFRWLPAISWYVTPIAIVAVLVSRWRPARWSWPILTAFVAWPRTSGMLIVGNTDLWVAAFVALGLQWGWGWALIALKPSFAPLALLGVRRPGFWLGVALLSVVSLPFGRLWLDWFSVVVHAPGGLLYSILGLPLVLLPAVAYAGRTRGGALGRLAAPTAGVGPVD